MGEYLDRFRLSFVDPDQEIAFWDYEKLKQEFWEESMTINLKWNEGDAPPEAGWYLAAVNRNESCPDEVITLMLWYNADSVGKWYFGCGLGGNKGIDYNRSEAINGAWGKQYAIIKAWSEVPIYSSKPKSFFPA